MVRAEAYWAASHPWDLWHEAKASTGPALFDEEPSIKGRVCDEAKCFIIRFEARP